MKKVFILAVLSLLTVPCVSMAATMSDADLAEITGQSGVTIDISAMHIDFGLGTFTYGDLDGFTTTGSLGSDFTNPGYLNVAFVPHNLYPWHLGLPDIELMIDIGTSVTTSVTAVNIAGKMNGPITLDGIAAFIALDNVNGALTDYNGNAAHPYPASDFNYTYLGSIFPNDQQKILGLFCLSNISVQIPTLNIQISAH